MDKRRTIKFYGFIEHAGCLEDFYFTDLAQGVSHIRQLLTNRQGSPWPLYGVIMEQHCGIPDDNATWIVTAGNVLNTLIKLKTVKERHGSIDNYLSFLLNGERNPLEDVNWIKEGF